MSDLTCALAVDAYDDEIEGIRVRWPAKLASELPTKAHDNDVPLPKLKALCERVAYNCAARVGATQVVVLAVPHRFTVDSKTGHVRHDPLHVTAEIRGKNLGRKKVHIYLRSPHGSQENYDNMYMVAESVSVRGFIIPALSYGLDSALLLAGQDPSSTATGEASSSALKDESGDQPQHDQVRWG